MSQITLTGVEGTDRKILLFLDDEDLFHACSISHYLHKLCNSKFWFQKFFNTYHANLNQYGFSIDNDDYKKLYKKLRKMEPKGVLFYASQQGYLELVESMLDNVKVNIHVDHDHALRDGAKYGQLAVVKLLLNRGADVHANNDKALISAVKYSHRLHHEDDALAVVELLLAQGADLHVNDDEALRIASSNGQLAMVALLLNRGANLHAHDDDALICAAGNGQIAMVELLLANINNF